MAKAHTLIDNFNDNSLDNTKWTAYGNPGLVTERVQEINSRLELTPRSGDSGHYSAYTTNSTYDLTDSYAHVELVQAPRPAPGAQVNFAAERDGNNKLLFRLENGALACVNQIAGAFITVDRIPYDPQQHRWLRFREKSGTTFWEVSPDASTWTALVTKTTPISLNPVIFQLQVGITQTVASPGMVVFDNFNVVETSRARRTEERRLSARGVRFEAAELAANRQHPEHVNNNDEVNYPTRPLVGNFSKSLKHDSLGDPDPASYASLLRALQSEDPADFEEIQLGVPPLSEPPRPPVKLINPQSGLAFDIAGPDAQEITMPPAPRFDSEQTAHEMGELYWMAVARDVHFSSYGSNSIITAAVNSLNSEFPAYGGPRPVTAQNIFRGIYPGDQVGPYVSQFLLKGNVDQRKPDGLGRDANEGFISYGAQVIDQRIVPASSGTDYLISFGDWLAVQDGYDTRGDDQFDTSRRFIRNLRDGTTYVHFDQVVNAFYNAAWILMSEPAGNQLTFLNGTTGRPQIDLEFPKDQGNPYDPPGMAMDSRTQMGFGTFGPLHLLQILSEVLGRAIRAVWWQKWGVHRRLRPEEYGGRVRNQLGGLRTYPIHDSILVSLQSGGLAPYYGNPGDRFPSYLLPQAYPEGAPTHPAYGAGHATGSAACATILKAFFDESVAIENPVQASTDGLSLVSYTGTDATQMTVGGEINKLAGNIALFRDAAGVHWRSDYTQSFPLGEAVAIRMLQEMSLTFNEDDAFFELTKFSGQKIRIFDGKVTVIE